MKINIQFFDDKNEKEVTPIHKHKDDQFIIEWDKELGWKQNPFISKIGYPPDKFIAGYNEERLKINLFVIKKYFFGIITGDKGAGKTALLRWMEYELSKHKDKLYANFILGKTLTNERETLKYMVMPLLGPLHKIINKQEKLSVNNIYDFLKKKLAKKRLILLIDDVNEISDLSRTLLKSLFETDLQIQVIVSGTKEEIEKSEIKEITNKESLRINLPKLEFAELRLMLKKRIEAVGGKDILPFTDEEIKRLIKKSDNNPKKLLELCYNDATEISVEKWHNEKALYESNLKKLEIEEKAREEKLKLDEKEYTERIRQKQSEEKVLIKEEEEMLERQDIEDNDLSVTDDDLENELINIRSRGHKEKEFDTSLETRKKRLEDEKRLKKIFEDIEKKLKK